MKKRFMEDRHIRLQTGWQLITFFFPFFSLVSYQRESPCGGFVCNGGLTKNKFHVVYRKAETFTEMYGVALYAEHLQHLCLKVIPFQTYGKGGSANCQSFK